MSGMQNKPPAFSVEDDDVGAREHRRQIVDYCGGISDELRRTWSMLQPSLNGRYRKGGVAGEAPAVGEWTVNNANPFLVTELRVHNTDLDGGNFGLIWAGITPNDLFQNATQDLSFLEDYVISGQGTQTTGYWTFPVANGLTNVGGGFVVGTQTWTTAWGRASDRANFVQYVPDEPLDWIVLPTLVNGALDGLAARSRVLEVGIAAVQKTTNHNLPGGRGWEQQSMDTVLDDDQGFWDPINDQFDLSILPAPPSGWHYSAELNLQGAIETPENLGMGFIGVGSNGTDPEAIPGPVAAAGGSMPDKDKAPILWTTCLYPRVEIDRTTFKPEYWARGGTDDPGKPVVLRGGDDGVWMKLKVFLVRDDFQSPI